MPFERFDDDESRVATTSTGSSKAAMRELLAAAVRNTGGVPIEVEFVVPNTDQIAMAIVAACRETGADPEAVARQARGNRHHPDIGRARAYAALALRAVFETANKQMIARVVGSRSWSTYLATLDEQRKRGFMEWWDGAAFMRVISAIENLQTENR